MAKLTKRVVDAAETRAKPYFIWCTELPGFGCRVHPSGRRAYYADYRNATGNRKRMSVGVHGRITTEEARRLALQVLGGATKGEDPATERATRRNSLTIAGLAERYMAAAEKGLIFGKRALPKKASTIAQDRARLDRHILPLLGQRLVRDLTRADVARFIAAVTTGKTAVVEKTGLRGKAVVTGGAGAAARTANFLGALLTFAVDEGVIEHNVAHGVPRQADQKRTRRLTPAEYRALGTAIDQAEQNGDTWQGVLGAACSACRVVGSAKSSNCVGTKLTRPAAASVSRTRKKARRCGQSAALSSISWRTSRALTVVLLSCQRFAATGISAASRALLNDSSGAPV
jgi:hypothetical protein